MPALTTLTAAGVPGRRRTFAPKSPSESGGGRPSLTRRLTRLSAAGVPEAWKARASRSQAWDGALAGSLPRLASVLPVDVQGVVIFEIRLDYEFEPTLRSQHEASMAQALPRLQSTLTGLAASATSAALGADLARLAGDLQATFDETFTAAVAGSLPSLGGALAGSVQGYAAELQGPLAPLGGAVAGTHTTVHAGPLIDFLPRLTGGLAGTFVPSAFVHVLGGGFSPLGGSLTGAFTIPQRDAELAGEFARLTGGIREATPVSLATRITLAGRIIDT